MQADKLLSIESRDCYLIVDNERGFNQVARRLAHRNPTAVVRMVRGFHCSMEYGFFTELSAALQFPYYFGYNWHAFDDCLQDMRWQPGTAYLIFISLADTLFNIEEDPEKLLGSLVRHAAFVREYWQNPPERAPAAFHIVFGCPPEEQADFEVRLQAVNADYELLDVDSPA